MSGNNLPRIRLIRGKLFPDGYLHHIPACWFVVVSRVGCLGVTGVAYAIRQAQVINFIYVRNRNSKNC